MAIANLIEKKWLWRNFYVLTADGGFEVAYNGKGAGYEEITVNGKIACRRTSLWWYVPKFDFHIGESNVSVNVKISPLMRIKRFDLSVDGRLVYSE